MKRKSKAKAKKKNKAPWLWGWLAFAAIVAVFLIGLWVRGNIVHVMRATVYIADLPRAFEGRTILYATDIDIGSDTSPAKAANLFRRLEALKPDMLILGGDYTTHTLLQRLDGKTEFTEADARNLSEFFHYIYDFSAPLGRFALFTDDESAAFPIEGFEILNDRRCCVELDGEQLWLVGVTEKTPNVRKGGRSFKRGECVIAVADSPSVFPILNTTEAKDGGHWPDMCLAGATHGGQIRLLDRNLLPLNSYEQHYLYGWAHETGIPMLTTSGVGCEGANLRFGTQSEVWLITLTNNG